MRTSYTEDSSVCGGKEFNVTGRSTELLSASWKKISRLLLELHIQVFAWRMKWDASGMEYHPVNWHRENCPFREDDLLINKGNVQKLNSNGIVVVHDGPFMWVWWGVFSHRHKSSGNVVGWFTQPWWILMAHPIQRPIQSSTHCILGLVKTVPKQRFNELWKGPQKAYPLVI